VIFRTARLLVLDHRPISCRADKIPPKSSSELIKRVREKVRQIFRIHLLPRHCLERERDADDAEQGGDGELDLVVVQDTVRGEPRSDLAAQDRPGIVYRTRFHGIAPARASGSDIAVLVVRS